jgi:signal transduction histidine kinase
VVHREADAAAAESGYRQCMNVLWPRVGEAVLAAICALWAAFFLAAEGSGVLLAAPLAGLAVLPYRRRPVLAGLAVAALAAVHTWLLAVPSENPSLLAALFVVVYALGRYAMLARSAAPALLLLAAFVAGDPTVPTLVFGTLLFSAIWGFGRLVRRRTDAAEQATATAAELADLDPAARARQVVAEERARLAGEALAVVRAAVAGMHRLARDAADTLDPDALAAIQDEGRRATGELRRLLGLLRSEAEASAAREGVTARRRPWRVDLLTAAGLGSMGLLESVVEPAPVGAVGLALVVLLAATVALRRTDPALACVLAVAPLAAALFLAAPVPVGLWTGAVAALLAWSATTHGHLRDYAALAVFAGVLLLHVHRYDPGNEAILLAVLALAAVAGHLWAARDREERSATAIAARLRAEHQAVAQRAVRAERLRLARELHDVASHGVGVMVLQAGAAAALRPTDPDRARAAVRAVQAAGEQALSELEVLFGLLDAGAVGAPGLATAAPVTDLADSLEALVDRTRQADLRVSLGLHADLNGRPELAATAYRIVQEALTNAVKYANASTITVRAFEDRDRHIVIEIKDDGARSWDPTETGRGHGIRNMYQRAHDHDIEIDIGGMVPGVRMRIPAI